MIKFIIDMNLSPRWEAVFKINHFGALHWSNVGDPRAKDHEIMQWASDNGYIVFTHDLDFTTLLAITEATGPSVIQVRTQNVLPEVISENLFKAIKQFEHELKNGALVSIDYHRSKVRVLPLKAKHNYQ